MWRCTGQERPWAIPLKLARSALRCSHMTALRERKWWHLDPTRYVALTHCEFQPVPDVTQNVLPAVCTPNVPGSPHKHCSCIQACFGHTEGTAGITGLLLAASGMQQAAHVPVVHLRGINPYVAAAIGDMKGMAAHATRQLAPGVLLTVSSSLVALVNISTFIQAMYATY